MATGIDYLIDEYEAKGQARGYLIGVFRAVKNGMDINEVIA